MSPPLGEREMKREVGGRFEARNQITGGKHPSGLGEKIGFQEPVREHRALPESPVQAKSLLASDFRLWLRNPGEAAAGQ